MRLDRLEGHLSAGLESRLTPVLEKQAQIDSEIQDIKKNLEGVSGSVNENRLLINHAVERDLSERDAIKASILELERGTRQIQAYLGLEPQVVDKDKQIIRRPIEQHRTRTPAGPVPLPPESNDYEKGLSAFEEGNLREALAVLGRFVENHPESDRADDARFLIGECHMGLKQYKKAILCFHDFISRYPGEPKVADAMLKQARAFHAIGDNTSTRMVLNNIIEKYPGSSEAETAEKRLEEVNGRTD